MLLKSTHAASLPETRSGIVLLVVIAMLALFAAVGLSFVYYAQAEADAARLSTLAQTQGNIDIDPEFLLSYGLGQLLYGVDDISALNANNNLNTNHNVYSAMRGRDLARNMYGYNRNALNVTPFNGVQLPATQMDPNLNQPVINLINFQYDPRDGFIRDPGRIGPNRANPAAAYDAAAAYVGENVPWTYADLNSVFLAQINGTGEVLIPSFWRNWTGITSLIGANAGEAAYPAWRRWDPTEVNPANIPPRWMKHATLRPLPWYNRGDPNAAPGTTGFPPPEDGGGDVRNFEGGPGIRIPGTNNFYKNDSIWIDLGFPVRSGPNGKLYKPLFAFLICDLDGKVNLNVAGNLRRQQNGNYEHGSNQGLGPWEINPNHVLTAADWRNVLQYRYDQSHTPGAAANATNTTAGQVGGVLPGGGMAPPFYAFMDFDAVQDNFSASQGIVLPGVMGNGYANQGNTVPFPYIPAATYGGGSVAERTNHPALYNYFNPTSNDRRFSVRDMEAPYRYRGTGSPSLTADLFRFAPQNFQNGPQRLLSTLLSFDLARPGLTPWLNYDPNAAPVNPYQLNGLIPAAAAQPLQPIGASPNIGDYGPDYRGWAAAAAIAQRLDINRMLTDYPPPDANGRIDIAANATQLQNAINERQALCTAIFQRLRFVTTGARPTDPIDVNNMPAPQYNALRWLAQLAVNIVDLRDVDNIMTTFFWDTAANAYVVGTELPRLVVNEVYAEVRNDPNDPGLKTMDFARRAYNVNFWVELLNPMPAVNDPYTGTLNEVRLQVPGQGKQQPYAAYTVAILDVGQDASLRDAANVLGDPDFLNQPKPPRNLRMEVANYDPTGKANVDDPVRFRVQAVGDNPVLDDGGNTGFYVLGPDIDFPQGANPNPAAPTATLRVNRQGGNPPNDMTYDLLNKNDPNLVRGTVLLRRLANPGLPPQPNANQANFNPYVSVDYLENIKVNDAVEVDQNGVHANLVPREDRRSVGRRQPYAAATPPFDPNTNQYPPTSQGQFQNPNPRLMDQPQHRMFYHNTAVVNTVPFNWLTHLDRNFASPAEIMHVSGFRPHELTQQFITVDANGLPQMHNHRAPWNTDAARGWNADTARIYRLLELVDAGLRMQGVSQSGRFPGKINLNTIWDEQVFQALCDAPTGSNWNVAGVFADLLMSRSPNNYPSQGDNPFQNVSAPNTGVGNNGLNATILRAAPAGSTRGVGQLFDVPGAHPVEQKALLSKIFNNVTTRSNVFAVWMTVGFFEVHAWPNNPADEAQPISTWPTLPGGTHYELGKEIGKDENRHIRHRMFSIVDRTELVLPNANGPDGYSFRNVPAPYVPGANGSPGQLTVPPPPATYATRTGDQIPLEITYQNQAGTVVTGMVMVNVTGNDIWTFANVPLPLNANQIVLVTLRGNPGPQLRFDHRLPRYTPVVPYYSIIQ